MARIRIAITGYSNLGRGVESEISRCADMELVAVFIRKNPAEQPPTASGIPLVHIDDAAAWVDKIDVMIMCTGSAQDQPRQGPLFASLFNTVDSFDTHTKIPQYFGDMDAAATAGGKISVISAGWDPGLFSLMRLYLGAVLPDGKTYTFWGPGVSQGHSTAIRGIDGVIGAVQYSVPVQSAVERIRSGETPELSARETIRRMCYVAAADGADRKRIERDIQNMPDYFADYDTEVNFITPDELAAKHGGLPHGGNVIHAGQTGSSNGQQAEFSLRLDSNPEFTASVMLAYARAAGRLSSDGETGARTVFDIPPRLLLPGGANELWKLL